MIPLSRPARVLASIAVVSLVAMVLAYTFPPGDRRAVVFISDLCWTWSSAVAAFACFIAARRVTTSEQRRAWRWIGIGGTMFLVGQLIWNFYDIVGNRVPYPSIADIGFLGVYACLIVGLLALVRGQPTLHGDPELILDTVL